MVNNPPSAAPSDALEIKRPGHMGTPLWCLTKLHAHLVAASQDAFNCGDTITEQLGKRLNELVDEVELIIRAKVRQR